MYDKIFAIALDTAIGAFIGLAIWLVLFLGVSIIITPFVGFNFAMATRVILDTVPAQYQMLFTGALGGVLFKQGKENKQNPPEV